MRRTHARAILVSPDEKCRNALDGIMRPVVVLKPAIHNRWWQNQKGTKYASTKNRLPKLGIRPVRSKGTRQIQSANDRD